MRGTLLDDETMRYQGIKEMKQAAAVREHRQKEEAERKLRELARVKAGRSLPKPLPKQPLLPLSFMRNRPKVIARGSTRPTVTTRKSSSSNTQKKKQPSSSSRPRHTSASGKRNSKRPATSRKSSHASHASRRNSKK